MVTGGCGYIGSHTIVDLIENGFDIISVDNNSRSSEHLLEGIEKITGKKIKNYKVDLCDFNDTSAIFEENEDIAGIIHFAAYKAVGESVEKPLLYFENNLVSLINLLKCVEFFKIPYFVFSSSCTVYGNPDHIPVTETSPTKAAESPYGYTKQMGKPQNLVPVITQSAIGKLPGITVFGNNYDTRDGSCVRDFIHVSDLAHAHTLALQYLIEQKSKNNPEVFNLGTGSGITVLETIKTFEKITGVALNYSIGANRPGDVIAIYANNDKARQQLGWQPQFALEDILSTAWAWEQKLKEDEKLFTGKNIQLN